MCQDVNQPLNLKKNVVFHFLEQTGNVGFEVERNGRTFLPVPLVYRKLNPESIRQTDIFSDNGSFTNVIDGKIETSHPVAIFHAVSTRFYRETDVNFELNLYKYTLFDRSWRDLSKVFCLESDQSKRSAGNHSIPIAVNRWRATP